jgi:hypothetical protein
MPPWANNPSSKLQNNNMKIYSLEEACEKRGFGDPKAIMPDFSMYPEKHREALQAVAELFLINDASREKDPDWNDDEEEKYLAWMDMEVDENNPTGFRFDVVRCTYTYTYTGLGSRLCSETEEDAKHLATHFEDKLRAVMVIKK